MKPAYSAARLEWGTRFAYPPEVATMLRRFAGVRPGMRIVELGCGTGFWGRVLAEGLRGRGSLLATDLDPRLVRRARRLARAAGLTIATYRAADATRTGIRGRSADLVTCHRLLCVVPDPQAVVGEMARLARPGGRVVLNEHDHSADVFYDPDDPGLSRLSDERNAAFIAGFRRLYGGDHSVGSRTAALLVDAGLVDVSVTGVLAWNAAPPFDCRVSEDELRAYFEWMLESQLSPDASRDRAYRAGGWSARAERAFLDRMRRGIERRLASGDLRGWGRVSLVPRVIARGTVPV